MASMPNLYDPTQFQFLGAAQPAVPAWINPTPASPMGNTRAIPDFSGMTPSDRGFLNSNYGYTGSPDVPAAGGGGGGMWDSFQQWMKSSGMLGSTDANGVKTDGWGGLALGGASAAANLLMGLQQYSLARDQLNISKEAFGKNFEAQRKSTNSALSDRQAARVASNPGGYESVGDYMKKYGV